MRRPRVSGEVSFFLHIHAKKMRLTSTPSHFVTAPRGMPSLLAMPGAIAASTFFESLADASVAAADAAFASLYDGMQKNETDFYPSHFVTAPRGLIFRNRITGGKPVAHDLDIVRVMHVGTVVAY